MKKIITSIISVLISATLFSCEEVVEIKTPEQGGQIAVEGKVVSQPGKSYVRLTLTGPYFSPTEAQAVTGATVVVKDNEGKSIVFAEVESGWYRCPNDFKGLPGSAYSLEVNAPGNTITAKSTMPEPIMMDSVHIEHVTDGDAFRMAGYHLYATIRYKSEGSNYFMVERFVNGKKTLKTASDIEVFDDRFLTGITNGESSMLAYWSDDETDDNSLRKGDVVTMKLYSLDRAAYDYLKSLKETPSMGGMFGKYPANVASNVKGGLGLFEATVYSESEEVVVD